MTTPTICDRLIQIYNLCSGNSSDLAFIKARTQVSTAFVSGQVNDLSAAVLPALAAHTAALAAIQAQLAETQNP